MKKAFFLFLSVMMVIPLFSADNEAVLRDIKGKVEVKPLGKAWIPAKEGMTVDLLTTISTGFNSSAVLAIADNTVSVEPLTRLTVDNIVQQAGSLNTNLHLRVGKVSAQVKSSKGLAQDFKVTSPYSTASVRGTEFTYDGLLLAVTNGTVMFIPGRPTRQYGIPAALRTTAAADEEGTGNDEAVEAGEENPPNGEAEPGDTDAEGGGDVPDEGPALATVLDALQTEFPDDNFEPSEAPDTGASGATPAGATPPTAPGIAITQGKAAIITIDYSQGGAGGPATKTVTGNKDDVENNAGATPSGGGAATPETPAPTPPAPTKGSIKITITG